MLDQRVRVPDRQLVPLRQRTGLEVVLDALDQVLCQPLLLRTCEAKVPSDAAVVDASAPKPADLLGGLIQGTEAPQLAVVPVEQAIQLGPVLESPRRSFG